MHCMELLQHCTYCEASTANNVDITTVFLAMCWELQTKDANTAVISTAAADMLLLPLPLS
jgi:hypothetical protein